MIAERGVALGALTRRLADATISGDANLCVNAIETDSRSAGPGALFVAMPGTRTDGHRYVADAVANGASAVVVERSREVALPDGVAVVRVDDARRALSAIAAAFYGDPSHALDVVAVTGTNGKTTATHMIAAIFEAAGRPCGIVGTVGAQFAGRNWRLANTTPLPPELHRLLAAMREAGARAVAMEVSSHALALARVEDVRFAVAALTNVTRDHLDFHATLDAYAAAKRRLFALAPAAVLNVDDAFGRKWAGELLGEKRVLTYGTSDDAMLRARDIAVEPTQTAFTLDGRRFALRLLGRFNVWNALAAIGVARLAGIDDATSARGLASLQRVPGRMEWIVAGDVTIVVDYAHTPDALENALTALRETASGALAVVFGCGGDRDRGKRAEMGAAAARLADRLYVTTDNPRGEEPRAIADAVVAGIAGRPHVVELDRRRAIERAIAEAAAGDVVLIAGKGHESYQIVGDRVLPFDDVAVAREALSLKQARR